MVRNRQKAASCIVCVIGCALLVLVQRILPDGIGSLATSLLYFTTILVAGVLGGWKSGLTAVVSGLCCAIFLFSPTYLSRVASHPIEFMRLATFVVLGSGLTAVCEMLQRAWRRIEDRQRRLEKEVEERKQIEASLRQLAEDLSEADRRKDEFLATLAHELRNPLAPLRSGLELLRVKQGDQGIFEQTRTMMERQLSQMVRLVDDLMDVSRINHGKLELRMENFNLATAINNALETSRSVIQAMRHEVLLEMPQRPVFVHADPVRLSQVFMNLITNAAKYSDHGKRIWITVQQLEKEVLVSVRDEGIGLAATDLPHVFDLFSQINNTMAKSQGGLGIGLSLVKRLTERQGGQIEVKSDGIGKGSVFTVRLQTTNEGQPSEPRDGKRDQFSSALRILIVDDNRDSADSLSMLLNAMGNQTKAVYDGPAAINASTEFAPDVILLDIGLPVLNGYEVCRRIRQQTRGRHMVIVAQTGWGAKEDREKSKEAGFDAHLVKPIDPQALMELLVRHCHDAKRSEPEDVTNAACG